MFKQLGHRRPRELITHMSHQSYIFELVSNSTRHMFELVSNLTTDYQTHMFGLVSHLDCRTLQHHLDNLGLLGLRRLGDALGQLALKLRRGLGLPWPPPSLAITAASLCIHRAGDLYSEFLLCPLDSGKLEGQMDGLPLGFDSDSHQIFHGLIGFMMPDKALMRP